MTYKAFEQTVSASELDPVRSVLDGQGRIQHTERKVNGVLEEVDALYNAGGQITSMSLQNGRAVHRFLYDTLGRLVWAHDPDIQKREMRYSDEGMLIRHKNGADNVLAFFYDHAGRLTGRGVRGAADFVDPAASAFAPPATGDYVYHYDRRADEVATACGDPGAIGRLAAVDEPAGNAPGAGRAAFCYDQLGRQAVMYRKFNGANPLVGWQYDQLAASGLPLGSRTDDGFNLVPDYDRAGRLMSLAEASHTQPTTIWRAGKGPVADSYTGMDAAGRVLGETFGNGVLGTYMRDELGLTKSLDLRKGTAASLFGLGITRNKYGAPTIVSDTVATGLDQNARYAYDGAGRLTNADVGPGASPEWRFRYEYDGLQNMIARTQKGPTATSSIGVLAGEYYYGENNQGPRQLSRIVDKDCGGAATTFTYDGAGRMTGESSSGGSKTLTYDGYDQLLKVAQTGKQDLLAAYGYDGLRTYSKGQEGEQYWFTPAYTRAPDGDRWHYVSVGDRLVARLAFPNPTQSPPIPTPSGGAAGGFVRDLGHRLDQKAPLVFASGLTGAMLVLLVIGLRRRPASRTVPAVVGSYVLLLTMMGCEPEVKYKMLEEKDGSRIYFHQGMAAGPTLLTKPDGGIKEERRFEPFGQPINGTLNKSVDPMNNLNKETNPDTGWSYHGARWMPPQTARWQSPDPPVKAPDEKFMAEPWALNPYAYVKQSPTRYWDPDGNADEEWAPRCGPTGTTDRVPLRSNWKPPASQLPVNTSQPTSRVGGTVTIGIEANSLKAFSGGVHNMNMGDPGHVYLIAKRTDGTVHALSFGPGRTFEILSVNPETASTPGKTTWPLKDESAVEYTFTVGSEDFERGIQMVESKQKAPAQFSMKRNCTSEALAAANQGFGLGLPAGEGTLKYLGTYYKDVPSPFKLKDQMDSAGYSSSVIRGAELESRRSQIANQVTQP